MPSTYDLSARTAVVTGASKGIGRRIAERLRDAGAQVWNFDVAPTEVQGIRQSSVNITDADQIARGISEVLDQTSRIDISRHELGVELVYGGLVLGKGWDRYEQSKHGGWKRRSHHHLLFAMIALPDSEAAAVGRQEAPERNDKGDLTVPFELPTESVAQSCQR